MPTPYTNSTRKLLKRQINLINPRKVENLRRIRTMTKHPRDLGSIAKMKVMGRIGEGEVVVLRSMTEIETREEKRREEILKKIQMIIKNDLTRQLHLIMNETVREIVIATGIASVNVSVKNEIENVSALHTHVEKMSGSQQLHRRIMSTRPLTRAVAAMAHPTMGHLRSTGMDHFHTVTVQTMQWHMMAQLALILITTTMDHLRLTTEEEIEKGHLVTLGIELEFMQEKIIIITIVLTVTVTVDLFQEDHLGVAVDRKTADGVLLNLTMVEAMVVVVE
jgi:hypothetical protein